MSIVLKDWYGNDQTYNHDKIFVRDENGELVQFTQGTGEATLELLEITENGTYTPNEGVDGFSQVTVNVESASPYLHYVTFMSSDGTEELGKKPVADGDDCADPIARGIFNKPTMESTDQYDYTHNGWATEPNGALNSSALKSVTEDRTVYATFSSTLRNYTITYYDDDGTTLLNTETLAYGSMPSYAPTKDGYVLAGWNPKLVAVTGDASYTAQWINDASFATAEWAVIRSILASGQADTFTVGDIRSIPVKTYDGTQMDVDFEIRFARANSLILISKTAFTTDLWREGGSTIAFNTTGDNGWASTQTKHLNYAYDNVIFYGLPEELQGMIVTRTNSTYTKTSDAGSFGTYTTSDKVWIPSNSEMNSWYSDNASRIKKSQNKTGIGSATNYATRDMRSISTVRPSYVDTIGQVISTSTSTPYSVNLAPIAMQLTVLS